MQSYRIINSAIEIGDEIIVKITKANKDSISTQPILFSESTKCRPLPEEDIKELLKEKLEYFRRLEAKLKEEGLI